MCVCVICVIDVCLPRCLGTVCRQYTSDYKLETYLKIARLYLEDEDPVQAEAYINRASLLQSDSSNEELQIYYKVRVRRTEDSLVTLPHVQYCKYLVGAPMETRVGVNLHKKSDFFCLFKHCVYILFFYYYKILSYIIRM